MKAVVIGGSGATGKVLVEKLLEADWVSEVVVLVRRRALSEHPKLLQVVVDFDRLEHWSSLITGNLAFSCLGTTLKAAGSKKAQWKVDYEFQYRFAEIAARNGIPTFVLMSSQQANAASPLFYVRMKGKLEKSIEQLQFPSLLIHQPGMLLRPDTDRLGERVTIKVLAFLNGMGLLKPFAPTPVDVVAEAMLQSARNAPVGVVRFSV